MQIGSMTIELLVGFAGLFLLTKILGKTQITQITPFDFISALVLGELVGNAIYDDKAHIGKILYVLLLWGILIYVIEVISQKFKGTRKLLEGEPSIVIRKGKLQREVLKKNKLDLNQLQHLLRAKNAFSIREVEFAILETDGKVSVLKKSQYDTPTMQDMNVPLKNVTIPVTLIIDGELVKDNLKQLQQDESWLKAELAAFAVSDYKQVFYAEYKEGEGLFVDRYE